MKYKVGDKWRTHETGVDQLVIFIPIEEDYVVCRDMIYGDVYAYHINNKGNASCGAPELVVMSPETYWNRM